MTKAPHPAYRLVRGLLWYTPRDLNPEPTGSGDLASVTELGASSDGAVDRDELATVTELSTPSRHADGHEGLDAS